MAIEKVAVIGAGVMGAGIAAHAANAGLPVVLLDIVAEGVPDRSAIARGAVARLLKSDPAAFMHRRFAERVTPGNLEDDLALVADADWIIEAVVERADVKRDLYARLDRVRKAGSIVSSNTSTIPLERLVEGLSERFTADFLITHFFNPPRYMRLLELVAGPRTRADAVAAVRELADRALGKGVVDCKDTPGFVANRIGTYWIQCAVLEAIEGGLTVEEADSVVGKPMGVPRTGVFGLIDLVGLDLMPHIMESLRATLPADDPFHEMARVPALAERMIADGYTGRKGKGGFYRINREGGRKVKEAIDLATGEYRPTAKARLESVAAARSGLRALVEHPDAGGRYAWRVLSRTLAYTASLVPAIADEVVAVDTAMRLGYAWKFGPFELIDKLGAAWLAERLAADGLPVPALLTRAAEAGGFYRVHAGRRQFLTVAGDYADVPRAEGVLLLEDVKLRGEPIAKNPSASLWDIGDGVVCLEFHAKMNALDPLVLDMIREAVRLVKKRYKALVVYNEGSNFSVGANLGLLLYTANVALWPMIEGILKAGQDAYKALKYAPFPVVGAPSGMALGGGCEILLHCDALQAHAETYAGLVEVGVGVIPAWGGCTEMLGRWTSNPKCPRGPMPAAAKVFEMVSTAQVAKSAHEARDALILRAGDGITMNRDRLLADAKARALAMVEGYAPPEPVEMSLPGPSGKAAMAMAVDGFRLLGKATAYDCVVADALSGVLSGGATDPTEASTEDDVRALERRAFMGLVRRRETLDRLEHMLETGRPLRN